MEHQPCTITFSPVDTEKLDCPSDRVWHLDEQATHSNAVVTSRNRNRITLVEHRPGLLRNTIRARTIVGINPDNGLFVSVRGEVAEILKGQTVQQPVVQSQIHLVTELLDAGKISTLVGSILINYSSRSSDTGRHNRHQATIKIGCTGGGCRCRSHSVTLGSQDTLDSRITGRQGVRSGDQNNLIPAGTH